MSTARTVGETKFWVNDVLYMVPDPVADEIYRLKTECIDELMGQKTSLDAYYKAKQARLSSEGRDKDSLIMKIRAQIAQTECTCEVAYGPKCPRCGLIERVEKLVSEEQEQELPEFEKLPRIMGKTRPVKKLEPIDDTD